MFINADINSDFKPNVWTVGRDTALRITEVEVDTQPPIRYCIINFSIDFNLKALLPGSLNLPNDQWTRQANRTDHSVDSSGYLPTFWYSLQNPLPLSRHLTLRRFETTQSRSTPWTAWDGQDLCYSVIHPVLRARHQRS